MKNPASLFLFFLFNFIIANSALSQKKVSEFVIVYNYTINNQGADAKQNQDKAGLTATNTIYIKANMSRSDMTSALFSASTIYDAKLGSAVLLREVNGQKLLIHMTAEDWQDKNKRYQGLHFTNTSETKIIADYKCEKAIARTADGFTITVYYTKELVPENKEYDPQFKTLDGLPLEYELAKGNVQIKYSLASINLNPVPASRFDIPKSGYREMTYEESKKLNIEK
jgi:GLPGLI family protein